MSKTTWLIVGVIAYYWWQGKEKKSSAPDDVYGVCSNGNGIWSALDNSNVGQSDVLERLP